MQLVHRLPMLMMILALNLAPVEAAADDAGQTALAATEEAVHAGKTHVFGFDVVSSDGKNQAVQMRIKGQKHLVEFIAPADMKGTKLLSLSATESYVFLPAFGKIRRVASHTQSQGFMGLEFSQDDLTMQLHVAKYEPSVSDDTLTLTLTAKPGEQPAFSRIELAIDPSTKLPTELRFFDAGGKLAKTETRSDYTCEGAVCAPRTRKMVNHATNRTTTLTRKTWKVNADLSDDLFSKRNLAG
jgi:hypothetical protein